MCGLVPSGRVSSVQIRAENPHSEFYVGRLLRTIPLKGMGGGGGGGGGVMSAGHVRTCTILSEMCFQYLMGSFNSADVVALHMVVL